ncbi:hypothetical protein [Maridesulfovibrio ferrireducens]|nr:hypothetical protein [Maridesulfovibrio ferrireducens]
MNINIDRNYTRSVNISRDAESSCLSREYIPTARSLYTLDRIAKTISFEDTPRSWTLVGPYGAGKSSFGLFLASLLGNSEARVSVEARKQLVSVSPEHSSAFLDKTTSGKGFLTIIITGSSEPFSNNFFRSMQQSVKNYWAPITGPRPQIYKSILETKTTPTSSKIIYFLEQLKIELSQKGSKGILILVDELGKFLEYEARHKTDNDIYLLQELAEYAHKGSEVNTYIITLTHQAFDQYVSSGNKSQQEEWAKIQGRYENIPYIEPVDQTLKIVAKAIQSTADLNSELTNEINSAVSAISEIKALPIGLDHEAANKLFESCYPLHPLTAILLPLLCQKVAQNERTLFSFLGSDEPFGFKYNLQNHLETEGFIYPWAIYDYFIANQSATIFDHLTHRRWAEVVSALERLGDARPSEINLLKTIGLINIIGAHGAIKASDNLLRAASPHNTLNYGQDITALQGKSLIQFRKFNEEYRVWQGSDFDIETAVDEELSQIKGFDLPANLNSRNVLPAIVANRHSITTGTFRFYSVYFADKHSASKINNDNSPKIIYFLTSDKESSSKEFTKLAAKLDDMTVLALCDNYDDIHKAVSRVIALRRVRDNRNELNSDPVSLREFKDSLIAARDYEDSLLIQLIKNPEQYRWTWKNKKLLIATTTDFQKKLSNILSEVYNLSPTIKNELINKQNPSAQASTGRNRLIAAMFKNENQENLGIIKYPSERSIYDAVLKATGLHKKAGDSWEFGPPSKKNDRYNILPVWNKIQHFLEETEDKPRPFTDLNFELSAPPFGIKEGVLPILYAAAYLYNRSEIALYEDGKYLPLLQPSRYELFIKRMDLFSVQLFKLSGANESLFRQYGKAFFNGNSPTDLQAIARPFAMLMHNLPEYSKKTESLPQKAIQIRKAYFEAPSPEELFFKRLPIACGYENLTTTPDQLSFFTKELIEALRALKYVYQDLLKDLQASLCQAFKIKQTEPEDIRHEFQNRFQHVERNTVNTNSIKTFIKCLIAKKNTNEQWIESVFSLVAQKPCAKWIDSDVSKASFELSKYSTKLLDLEKLCFKQAQNKDKNIRTILLKTVEPGQNELDQVICIDSDTERSIELVKKSLNNALSSLSSDSLKLAVLTDLVNDLLKQCGEE